MSEEKQTNPADQLVLVCVDECEHSLVALDWYYNHFYRQEHIVGLLHVYTPPEVPSFGKHHGNPHDVADDAEYQKRLQDAMKKCVAITNKFKDVCTERGIDTRVFIREKVDSIGHTICTSAKEHEAKCVVMGQRGLGAFKRTIFGSVSEYVLHHAHIAALIVPPPKRHKCSK